MTEPIEEDIVVRLRRWAAAHGQPKITISKTGRLLTEAADEIERLRSESR